MKNRSYHRQEENQPQQRQPSLDGAKSFGSGETVGSPLGTSASANDAEARITSPPATTSKAKQPRCRKVAARCRVAGCTARPWFGKSGERRPEACKDHRTDDEVNVYAPKCQAEGCSTRPHFGHEGERAKFCHSHKLPGMVDLLNKRCKKQGCNKQPSFSGSRGSRALFCKEHKEDGMLNTKAQVCLEPGCDVIASMSDGPPPPGSIASMSTALKNRGTTMGVPTVVGEGASRYTTESGDSVKARGAAKYCAAHAPRGSVNVVAMQCRSLGCSKQPSFGREGSGEPAMFCARHRKRRMTDVKNPRCWTFGCVAQPIFGREGDPRATKCVKHAEPDMVELRLKKCRKTGEKKANTAEDEAP